MGATLTTNNLTQARRPGLPPGTLIYLGPKRRERTTLRVMDYGPQFCQERTVENIEEVLQYRDTAAVTWVDVDSLHDVELVRRIGDLFGIDPLVLEDVLDTSQRPKAEDYGGYIFVTLKMLRYQPADETVLLEQISLILGPRYVISFQEGIEGDVFDATRRRVRDGLGRSRRSGADYLAYSLIDAVVDNYFLVMEQYLKEIEGLRGALLNNTDRETMVIILNLEQEVMSIRRAVWPLIEAISRLMKEKSPLIRGATKKYLRDVYDHVRQVIDATQTAVDMLDRMQDVYLSNLSNRMNEVMKVLTIVSTIFIPLTFIAGVYGMNFEFMPELIHPYGYPATLVLMAVVAVGMLVYFKRKDWL